MGYNTNYAFDFNISTKYSNIKNTDDLEITTNETKNNSKNINGYHKKKGQNKVQITSTYGNVTLTKKQ